MFGMKRNTKQKEQIEEISAEAKKEIEEIRKKYEERIQEKDKIIKEMAMKMRQYDQLMGMDYSDGGYIDLKDTGLPFM